MGFRKFSQFALLSLITSVLIAARDVVIAHHFSRGKQIDVYFASVLLPSLVAVWISNSCIFTLAPFFGKFRERNHANRFLRELLGYFIILFVPLSLLIGVVSYFVLKRLYPDFEVGAYIFWVAPIAMIRGIGGVFSAVLHLNKKFFLYGILPGLTPLLMVVALIQGQAEPLTLAKLLLLGSILETGFLAWNVKIIGYSIFPSWVKPQVEHRVLGKEFLPVLAAAAVGGFTPLIDTVMVGSLGVSGVSTWTYSGKLTAFFSGFGALVLGTISFPYFIEALHQRDKKLFRKTAFEIFFFLLLIIPVVFGISLTSQFWIRLIFQYGNFRAIDTAVVSSVQSILIWQTPFYILVGIGIRLLSAMRMKRWLLGLSVMNVLLNAVLNWILMKIWGIHGVAVSTCLVYAIYACSIGYILLKFLKADSNFDTKIGTSVLPTTDAVTETRPT